MKKSEASIKSAAISRYLPAVDQVMAVASHEDAGRAIPFGLDHAAIDDLAVRSGSKSGSKAGETKRHAHGELTLGDDVAAVDGFEFDSELPQWATAQRLNTGREGS